MRLTILLLLACVWANSAHAQQSIDTLCRELSVYLPIEGGRHVGDSDVSADLNAVEDPVYGSISIPVEIDLADYFNRPDLNLVQGLNLEPDVANIIINRDGSIFYNGQEISGDIQRVCGMPVSAEPDNHVPVAEEIPSKPKAKVFEKPKQEKKSSVRVLNGSNTVIGNVPEIQTEIKPEKPKAVDEKAIDEEVLKEQDSTDKTIDVDSGEDSIIEGQYP